MSAVDSRTLHRVVRDSWHFQRAAVLPFQGVRVAAGTAVAMALGTALFSAAAGAAAGGGSLAPGLASLDTEGRTRLGRTAATAAVMAVSTFLGSVTGSIGWLHVVLTGAWAAGWGLLAAVEPAIQVVCINAIVGLIVFGRFPESASGAAGLAAAVAAGGGVQTALVALLHPPVHQRDEPRALGRAFQALSEYALAIASGGSSLAAGTAVEAAAAAVTSSPVSGERREAWESLVNQAGRLRLELLTASQLRERSTRDGGAEGWVVPALDRLLRASATQLAAIGEVLSRGRPPRQGTVPRHAPPEPQGELAAALAAVCAPAPEPAPSHLQQAQLTAMAQALAGQIRSAWGLMARAQARTSSLEDVTAALRLRWLGGRDPGATVKRLRANLTWQSTALRHALRMAAAVSLAILIGHLSGLQRGYWIGLTAVIVLRPDFASTFSRGAARAVGTLLGVVLASLVAVTVAPHGVGLDVVVGVFTAAAASLLFASYGAFSVAVTGTVVFLLAGLGTPAVTDAEQRLLATLIGSALALAIYAAWPSWSAGAARQRLVELLAAEREYAVAVLRACAAPSPSRRAALPGLERRLRLSRTNAEAAVTQSLAEPAGRRLDPRWSAGVLAALRRVALAAHALRARLDANPGWPAMPGLEPFASAVGAALLAAGEGMEQGHAGPEARLRAARDAALGGEKTDGEDADPGAWAAVETDEMVNAIDTLRHLTASPATGPAPHAGPGAVET